LDESVNGWVWVDGGNDIPPINPINSVPQLPDGFLL
jgi:hypothetical protein